MNYPTKIITIGEKDAPKVKQIQSRLNLLKYGPIAEDGIFGKNTKLALKTYQSSHCDVWGHPLESDGKLGYLTWSSLFNEVEIHAIPTSPLISEVIKIALKENEVREDPSGSNRGPRVDEYLSSVNLEPGLPWCAAFVYWCFKKASAKLHIANPLVKTASCMQHWYKTKGIKIKLRDVIKNPLLIEPGTIFIFDRGNGKGHTGIVISIHGDLIHCIEGNTNTHLNQVQGVYETWREIKSIDVGFIKYG
jgi:hypothetical protein